MFEITLGSLFPMLAFLKLSFSTHKKVSSVADKIVVNDKIKDSQDTSDILAACLIKYKKC